MPVGVTRRGLKNRNLASTATFMRRPYTWCLSQINSGDVYSFQALDEELVPVDFQVCAGTVVGGTTVTVDLRKNGVSILVAPVSLVGKQGVNVAGILLPNISVGIGDNISIRFVNVGAGSFGQAMAVMHARPLVGTETRL